jgi:hypothetical protein
MSRHFVSFKGRRLLAFFLLLLLILILILAIFLTTHTTPDKQTKVQILVNHAETKNANTRTSPLFLTPKPTSSFTPAPGTPTPSSFFGSYPANIDLEPLGSYGTYSQAALSNPNIGAVDVNMNWISVEPQQGVFNWAPVDNEIAAWAGKGKKFTLVVRYIKEGTSGIDCTGPQYMPSWEAARIQYFCDRDLGTLIPDYFDATFQADLKAYVQAIAAHFAQYAYKNNLLYARIGLGEGGEGFPLMSRGSDYQIDKNQLIAWGYSPQNWAAWQKMMLSYYKNAFSYTTILYPVNGLDIDPTTGKPVQIEVADWAAAQGMGVGQQGLTPGENIPVFSYIRLHYPNNYIQFQTIAPVSGSSEVQGDIQTANQYGAQFIEWYSQDATNPAYQSFLQQWQQMVNRGTYGK